AMSHVIDAGVRVALGHEEDAHCPPQLRSAGAGLAALSEGFVFCSTGDRENHDRSAAMYDALHAFCAGYVIEADEPGLGSAGFMPRLLELKSRLRLTTR